MIQSHNDAMIQEKSRVIEPCCRAAATGPLTFSYSGPAIKTNNSKGFNYAIAMQLTQV
jgi:hypothetical protein